MIKKLKKLLRIAEEFMAGSWTKAARAEAEEFYTQVRAVEWCAPKAISLVCDIPYEDVVTKIENTFDARFAGGMTLDQLETMLIDNAHITHKESYGDYGSGSQYDPLLINWRSTHDVGLYVLVLYQDKDLSHNNRLFNNHCVVVNNNKVYDNWTDRPDLESKRYDYNSTRVSIAWRIATP